MISKTADVDLCLCVHLGSWWYYQDVDKQHQIKTTLVRCSWSEILICCFIDIHQCMGSFPISPVDANSRPSLCLTNFLLGGRSVMLEQPRKSGAKILSHMLTSHGGQIYIHQLSTGRTILDDPPSISEGAGGRVIDYRIQVRTRLSYVCLTFNDTQTYSGKLWLVVRWACL